MEVKCKETTENFVDVGEKEKRRGPSRRGDRGGRGSIREMRRRGNNDRRHRVKKQQDNTNLC